MAKPHSSLQTTTINSEIFAIVDSINNDISMGKIRTSVETYSEKTRTWKHKYIEFEERVFYCISSFMSKLYIVGGWIKSSDINLRSCYTYDIHSEKLNKIAQLNVARSRAACTVFEGKIVVTGCQSNYYETLKSVEAYDYYVFDEFYFLPDLIKERINYAACTVFEGKIVVTGGKYNLPQLKSVE